MADSTSASALGSTYFFCKSFSKDPAFTPTLIGTSKSLAAEITSLIFFSLPCFLKAQDFIGDEDFNSKTSKGIVVIEFWAEWNSNNEVDFLNSLKDCKAYKLCIVKNSKLKRNLKKGIF